MPTNIFVNTSIPLEERLKQRVLEAMKFGQELTAEFGVMNVLSGKTNEEVALLSQALAPVQALLLSGALHTARDLIQSPALSTVDDQTKSYFVTRISNYLGD